MPFSVNKTITIPISVYNFEVAIDNSYIVENTIVHNCQSYSHGGKKNCTDKRGFLYQHFVRASKIIKPKVVIGENVDGILKRKDENGVFFTDLIIQEFAQIGYMIKIFILDTSNYGLPQKRKRVFFIGVHNTNVLSPNSFYNKLPTLSNLVPSQPIPSKANKNILEFSLENAIKIDEKAYEIPTNKFISNLVDISLPTGKPPCMLKKCIAKTDDHGLSFGKRGKPTYSAIIDIDDTARTIQCSYARMPRLYVPVMNSNGKYLRPYTVKELQRIQGFPDTFLFSGSVSAQIVQIGNAVPPPMVTAVLLDLFI
jgi:DNA (cytosine-5)-methyltransferase 1